MFELVDNKVVIDPDIMSYPEIKALWERDETPSKEEAFTYISFLFHYHNPKSSFYKGYPERQRATKIISQMFPKSMRDREIDDDKTLQAAMECYKVHLNLSNLRFLVDIQKQSIRAIETQLKAKRTSIEDRMDYSEKLNRVIEEMQKTEEMITKDEKDSRVKGARVVKSRER